MDTSKRQIQLIFGFIITFSLSLGMWEEYKSVWLEANGLSISNLSLIMSGSLFATAVIAVLLSFIFRRLSSRNVIIFCIYCKLLFMIAMIVLYQKNLPDALILVIFFLDAICGNLVVFSIYPLITFHVKNDKVYSKRKLVEYTMKDVSLAIAMIVLSFLSAKLFKYNLILIISTVFTLVSAIISIFIKKDIKQANKTEVKRLFTDKIVNIYMVGFILIGNIAYSTILGLQALLLKNLGGLTISQVSIFLLVACICGDAFGYLALWKLSPKNEYLTICLKFGVRFLFYFLVAVTGNTIILLISIFVSLLVSRAYENYTDGCYINRIRSEEQFAFTNYRYAVVSIGKAIGIALAGILFEHGVQLLFGIGIIFLAIQIATSMLLIYLRHKEEANKTVEISKI